MRKLAIGFWLAQIAAAFVMLFASAIEVESIVWSGPILTLVGLMHAIATRALLSWSTLLTALSGPLVCAFIAVCIAVFNWSPDEAETPIAIIMGLYTFGFYPATAMTLRKSNWDVNDSLIEVPFLRFSLKSMLLAMTAVCLAIVAARLISNAFRDDDIIFNGFALVTVTLCGLVIWRFVVYRRRMMGSRCAIMPFEFNRPTNQGCEDDI